MLLDVLRLTRQRQRRPTTPTTPDNAQQHSSTKKKGKAVSSVKPISSIRLCLSVLTLIWCSYFPFGTLSTSACNTIILYIEAFVKCFIKIVYTIEAISPLSNKEILSTLTHAQRLYRHSFPISVAQRKNR